MKNVVDLTEIDNYTDLQKNPPQNLGIDILTLNGTMVKLTLLMPRGLPPPAPPKQDVVITPHLLRLGPQNQVHWIGNSILGNL